MIKSSQPDGQVGRQHILKLKQKQAAKVDMSLKKGTWRETWRKELKADARSISHYDLGLGHGLADALVGKNADPV